MRVSQHPRTVMLAFAVTAVLLASGCVSQGRRPTALPLCGFEPAMLFPADHSLSRPEDGVMLADGRLIVADHDHGLRIVSPDGSSKPFGKMPGAGYVRQADGRNGAANGVSLDLDGTHLLVADVLDGGIYRVALADGATERIYRHPYGVNAVCRDSTGAVWFTQSTENTSAGGEARSFAAVDVLMGDGALWRLDYTRGDWADHAEIITSGLNYANGLVLDEKRGVLYLAELCSNRVLVADLDVARGRIGRWRTLAEVPTPDNLEMDEFGRLWVALPVANQVGVINPRTGSFRSVFHAQSPQQIAATTEFIRRGNAGESRLELLTPSIWEPLPGFVTGVILGPDGEVYVSGLGDALIRLPE